MRTFIPLAAVVVLTAGAVAIPALTDAQTAKKTTHHVWKKTNIDTAAMSASMSAGGASFEQPSAPGSNMAPGAVQPGAITSPDTAAPATAPAMPSTTDSTTPPAAPSAATAPAQPDTSAAPAAAASSSDSSGSAPQ